MTREPHDAGSSRRTEWLRRLDRIAADLNVLLLIFAIGLATLDLTFFVGQRVIERLPKLTRMVDIEPPANVAAAQANLP